jgi:hypothetical protein
MVMQSTEWLCEQVAIDLLSGIPSLSAIQKIHSRDFVISSDAKCLAVTAKTEEVLVPSENLNQRVLRMSLSVDLLTVIPEENEVAVDKTWKLVDTALLNPNRALFFFAHEFSHFTISGLSASDSATDDDRIIHTRTYTLLVARR